MIPDLVELRLGRRRRQDQQPFTLPVQQAPARQFVESVVDFEVDPAVPSRCQPVFDSAVQGRFCEALGGCGQKKISQQGLFEFFFFTCALVDLTKESNSLSWR